MFLPILSPNYMKSGACFEEACRAEARGLPAVVVQHDSEGWAMCMKDTKLYADKAARYRAMFSGEKGRPVHHVPAGGPPAEMTLFVTEI